VDGRAAIQAIESECKYALPSTAAMLAKSKSLGQNAPVSVSLVLERSARFSRSRPVDRAPAVHILRNVMLRAPVLDRRFSPGRPVLRPPNRKPLKKTILQTFMPPNIKGGSIGWSNREETRNPRSITTVRKL